jgi:non-ribosomal peptide synthetase component F
VQEWSDVPRGRPLFESILVVQNTPVAADLATRAGRLGVEAPRIHEQTNYTLSVTYVPGDRPLLRVGYDARRLDGPMVERLVGHFATLLAAVSADPRRRLDDLPMLSSTEQELLTQRWADDQYDPTRLGWPETEADTEADAVVPHDLDRLPDEDLDALIAAVRRSIEEDEA